MKNETIFSLNDRIINREDWNNAYQITQEIYDTWIQDSGDKRESCFIGIGCKTFLTTSILLISQTNYPDLLTVKTFLKLPYLLARLVDISGEESAINLGQKVANDFRQLLIFTKNCPEQIEVFEAIISEPVLALDSYFKQNNLTFTKSQVTERSSDLEQVLAGALRVKLEKILARS